MVIFIKNLLCPLPSFTPECSELRISSWHDRWTEELSQDTRQACRPSLSLWCQVMGCMRNPAAGPDRPLPWTDLLLLCLSRVFCAQPFDEHLEGRGRLHRHLLHNLIRA